MTTGKARAPSVTLPMMPERWAGDMSEGPVALVDPGFAPWIAYAVLSSFDWRIAIYTAAALATVGVIRPRREHDLNLLIGVTCVFFVVMAILALVAPHSGLHHWTPALSLATLAVIAFGSLVVHRPFTLPIAGRSTPEEYWHTPDLPAHQRGHHGGVGGRLHRVGRSVRPDHPHLAELQRAGDRHADRRLRSPGRVHEAVHRSGQGERPARRRAEPTRPARVVEVAAAAIRVCCTSAPAAVGSPPSGARSRSRHATSSYSWMSPPSTSPADDVSRASRNGRGTIGGPWMPTARL
jgi:hypothetical protein